MKDDFLFLFHTIYQNVCKVFAHIGGYAVMIWDTIFLLFTSKPRWQLIFEHIYEVGIGAFPLVFLTGLATGAVLAAQTFFQLSDKGLAGMTGIMVTKSMFVELGPVLTAFVITGRVGAATAAELGSMKVSEQVDAIASMGVNPIEYLIVPRCVAMFFTVPLLTIFSSAAGILGGWLISVYGYGLASYTFFDPIPGYINGFDIVANLSKSWIFGLLIISISCYRGINVRGGARGVGKATTASVVSCYISILTANFALTLGLNHSYWFLFGFS